MRTRLLITLLIYGVSQAFLFGVGMVVLMMSPLQSQAPWAIPAIIATSAILAIPLAWKIAKLMRARHVRLEAYRRRAGA